MSAQLIMSHKRLSTNFAEILSNIYIYFLSSPQTDTTILLSESQLVWKSLTEELGLYYGNIQITFL